MAASVPLAAEAFIFAGRPLEAEPLIDRLERNGRSLDRAWMLAAGARCRAMLLASRGDIEGAAGAAADAMKQHERLRCRSSAPTLNWCWVRSSGGSAARRRRR